VDNLVLRKYGIESEEPCKIHVCDECYRSLARNILPDAALANGFWVGTLPDRLQKATFIERAVAYPIRTKGHVVALESRRVNNIPGTAKRSMRETSVFYANNSSSVANELPLAVTGLLDMIAVVSAGKKKPRPSDLGRLLGARKSMIRDMIDYMLDKEDKLVIGFPLAKSLPLSEENLDSYSEDGAIPKVLVDSIL
ncbi:unnamed protein product, partial [Ectocarpus sp. 12 AP-2014]